MYSKEDKRIYLRGRKGKIIGEIPTNDFIKDGMIKDVSYNTETHILRIVFNQDSGDKTPIEIDLSSLMDVYTVGYGLKVDETGNFVIDTDVVAVVENVNKLSESLNISIDELNERLSATEKTLSDKIKTLTDSIANTKATINNRIDSVEKNYTDADTQIINDIKNLTTLN